MFDEHFEYALFQNCHFTSLYCSLYISKLRKIPKCSVTIEPDIQAQEKTEMYDKMEIKNFAIILKKKKKTKLFDT